jgi:hypothetical protein
MNRAICRTPIKHVVISMEIFVAGLEQKGRYLGKLRGELGKKLNESHCGLRKLKI